MGEEINYAWCSNSFSGTKKDGGLVHLPRGIEAIFSTVSLSAKVKGRRYSAQNKYSGTMEQIVGTERS